MKRVAIVGGGVAGLAAAYELARLARNGADVQGVLFEASTRLGGIVETVREGGFVIECGPDAWVTEKPSSSMRVGQYKLPKAEGDKEDASLVLYYFGSTQGGTAQANIDRWIGQMQQPDGSDSKSKAKTDSLTINGLKVNTVDVTGTYTAEMAPGSKTFHNDAKYRLRAAVVETQKGNYFVKLAGPEKTVARWDKEYTDYLKSFDFK